MGVAIDSAAASATTSNSTAVWLILSIKLILTVANYRISLNPAFGNFTTNLLICKNSDPIMNHGFGAEVYWLVLLVIGVDDS